LTPPLPHRRAPLLRSSARHLVASPRRQSPFPIASRTLLSRPSTRGSGVTAAAPALGAGARKGVGVRVPPSAPNGPLRAIFKFSSPSRAALELSGAATSAAARIALCSSTGRPPQPWRCGTGGAVLPRKVAPPPDCFRCPRRNRPAPVASDGAFAAVSVPRADPAFMAESHGRCGGSTRA
jgi:hypothetical protein